MIYELGIVLAQNITQVLKHLKNQKIFKCHSKVDLNV